MGAKPKPRELRVATDRVPGKVSSNGTKYSTTLVPARNDGWVCPVPPESLGSRGLTEWEKTWTAGFWLKPEMDYHHVMILARAYDDLTQFRKKVAEDGLISTGYAGQDVAHPLIAEVRKCETMILKVLSDLGFSPTARARLGVQEAKAQSALMDLKKRAEDNR